MELASWYNSEAIDIWKKYGSLQKLWLIQVPNFKSNADSSDADLLIIDI